MRGNQARSQNVFKSIVFVIENGQFWRGLPDSYFGASKWRNQARSQNVLKSIVFVIQNGQFSRSRQNLILKPQNGEIRLGVQICSNPFLLC
jgi:hypothetical protein